MSDDAYTPIVTSRPAFEACAWSADGRLVATVDADPSVWIWSAQDGSLIRRFPLGRTQHHARCAFTPQGHDLLIYGMESGVELRDAGSGALLRLLEWPRGRIAWAGFTPGGDRLVALTDDGLILSLDPQTWEWEGAWGYHGRYRLGASMSLDGRRIAVHNGPGTVRIFEVMPWRQASSIRTGFEEIETCALLRDGEHVAILFERRLGVWAVGSGFELWSMGPEPGDGAVFRHMAVAPARDRIAVAVRDGSRGHRIWLLSTFDPEDRLLVSEGRGEVRWLAFSPCGRRLAAAGDVSRVFALEEEERGFELAAPYGEAQGCAWLPTGELLVKTGRPSQELQIWTPETDAARVRLAGERSESLAAWALSEDGERLAVAEPGKAVGVWDLGSAICVQRLEGHRHDVVGISFSAKGQRLITLDQWGDGLVWDLVASRTLCRAPALSFIWNCVYCPGGRYALVQATPADPPSWRFVLRAGHIGGVNVGMHNSPLALTQDGGLLALAHAPPDDHHFDPRDLSVALVIWSLPGRKERWSVGRVDHHPRCGAFSPDGSLLATGGYVGEILLWDVATGDVVHELYAGTQEVSGVGFSPCGRWLAATSSDGSLRIWVPGDQPASWPLVQVIRFMEDGWVSSDGRRLTGTPGAMDGLRFSRRGELRSYTARDLQEQLDAGFLEAKGTVFLGEEALEGTEEVR
jgi:WD40 repeat protein